MTLLLCAAALTGCVSREQADAKLAKACEAGIMALLPEGTNVGKVAGSTFTASAEGQGLRHVALKLEHQDGWIEEDTVYECTFEESFGPMKNNFTASLYNLKMGEQSYGKFGNEILGDAQDFIKLTDAIRKSLYE
jgi:hypothetical protein